MLGIKSQHLTWVGPRGRPVKFLLDGCSVDSTGCLVGFYWMTTRILQIFFKCLKIANFIKKCNKNVYWTSSKISIGRLLESTGHLVELLYWMSTRTEDLADCFITFSSPLCHAKYKKTGDVYPWIKPLMMLKIILIILTYATTICVYTLAISWKVHTHILSTQRYTFFQTLTF